MKSKFLLFFFFFFFFLFSQPCSLVRKRYYLYGCFSHFSLMMQVTVPVIVVRLRCLGRGGHTFILSFKFIHLR